ncbi:hypothetical protein KA478_02005 [Patescibacteria group bacterium]|nr:hypothetical protein [Patescibacteria group bacterium]
MISTVVSLVIGFIWFSKFLFGPAYMKAMHMHQDNK